jgi:SAM-dependent methyltransferase
MNAISGTEEHFAFGENWKSFTHVLNMQRVEQAEIDLRRLFPGGELKRARFLDIGCGSGLSSLAAIRLGAAKVDAIDVDPNSVEAAKGTLTRFAAGGSWTARVQSVFDLPAGMKPDYDIVYSWGVLHHTGDMWRAIRAAASMVKPGGLLAIALYRKTAWCGFWRWEKKLYSGSPRFLQAVIRRSFMLLMMVRTLRQGRNPLTEIRNYHKSRGMSWSHDVHDWLGGYPYESTSAEEARAFLRQLGFNVVREFVTPPSNGRTGTGCDEFIALRPGGTG